MTKREINKRIFAKGLRKDYIARIIGVSKVQLSYAINGTRNNDTCKMIIDKLMEIIK